MWHSHFELFSCNTRTIPSLCQQCVSENESKEHHLIEVEVYLFPLSRLPVDTVSILPDWQHNLYCTIHSCCRTWWPFGNSSRPFSDLLQMRTNWPDRCKLQHILGQFIWLCWSISQIYRNLVEERRCFQASCKLIFHLDPKAKHCLMLTKRFEFATFWNNNVPSLNNFGLSFYLLTKICCSKKLLLHMSHFLIIFLPCSSLHFLRLAKHVCYEKGWKVIWLCLCSLLPLWSS